MKVYKNYIDGKFISSRTKKTFASVNPTNGKILGYFQKSDKRDLDNSITAAKKGFKLWSNVPAPKRGEILLNIASLLRKNKEQIGKLVTTEMGKVIAEGRSDVQEAIDIFEYMAGEGRRLFGITTPSELREKFCMTTRRPLGVCALISPWNFPIAIPAWKISAALICGNSVVFKPSSDTPLCAVRLIEIFEEAGVPVGVVNMITGSGEEIGDEIIKNNNFMGISFTGSKDVGRYILRNASASRIGLELGGKNPIIVMEDADMDLAVDGVIWGGFGTAGQRCTAASRVIIHKKINKEFEEKLLKRTKKLRIGDPLKESTDIGPLVAERAVKKTEYYVHSGKKEKARILCGGKRGEREGFFYEPTLFSNVKPRMKIAKEEIFGPIVSLIKVNNLKEAIKVCNSVEYGLSSSIYTRDIQNAFKAIEGIDAGLTYVNSSTIGSEVHLPFGGIKATGNGTREGGQEAIHEFSEIKTVYIDYSGRLQKAQFDTIKIKR
ncbi:aldehyde dehydrogenase family protein [Candidatus Woesearchaeota archaeon]|nr:aldehyde dehydrogenase family protein [Candidatus Woesearchaeota archaeon]